MSIQRFVQNGRYSAVVINNGTIYMAGQTPGDCQQDVQGQTKQVLEKIERLLGEYNSDKDHILSATIYLRDIADFARINEVWDNWVNAQTAPARTCVEARLAREDILIEITITAAQKA